MCPYMPSTQNFKIRRMWPLLPVLAARCVSISVLPARRSRCGRPFRSRGPPPARPRARAPRHGDFGKGQADIAVDEKMRSRRAARNRRRNNARARAVRSRKAGQAGCRSVRSSSARADRRAQRASRCRLRLRSISLGIEVRLPWAFAPAPRCATSAAFRAPTLGGSPSAVTIGRRSFGPCADPGGRP